MERTMETTIEKPCGVLAEGKLNYEQSFIFPHRGAFRAILEARRPLPTAHRHVTQITPALIRSKTDFVLDIRFLWKRSRFLALLSEPNGMFNVLTLTSVLMRCKLRRKWEGKERAFMICEHSKVQRWFARSPSRFYFRCDRTFVKTADGGKLLLESLVTVLFLMLIVRKRK